MLLYIRNGTRHFEGPKQKTFQEQMIKPLLRNVSFVTIIQNGLQTPVVTTTIQKPNVYLFVLYGSQNKQPLFPYTALTDRFL